MAYEIPTLILSQPTGSTNFLQYRLVRLSSAGGVVHTTGLSTGATGVVALGVSQEAPTASTSSTGRIVGVMVYGVTKVEASSRAIKRGEALRPTSGAVAAGTRLGGTVRPSTSAAVPYAVGIALTSCAASTTRRYISMLLKNP